MWFRYTPQDLREGFERLATWDDKIEKKDRRLRSFDRLK
jgi:hypothetical protein